MVWFELEKIFSRKIVLLGLAGLLFIGMVTMVEELHHQYDVITPAGEELHGNEGKEYFKERIAHYAGPLTEEKKEEILRTEKAADISEYSYFCSNSLYISMNENFAAEYGSFYGKTVDEVFTDQGIEVEVGNAYRWMNTFGAMQMFVTLLGFLIVIGVSGVFSEEYSRKMDALLLTAKYGKQKCAQAKVLASFLFTVICFGLLLLAGAVPFLLDDGLYGWDAGVQLDILNGLNDVKYTMNCKTAALLYVGGSFGAMLVLTAVTLLISVKSKTPFVSIIAAAVLYFLPVLLSGALPEEAFCLTPIGMADIYTLEMPRFYFGSLEFLFQTKILIVLVIFGIGAWIGSRQIFAKHQAA